MGDLKILQTTVPAFIAEPNKDYTKQTESVKKASGKLLEKCTNQLATSELTPAQIAKIEAKLQTVRTLLTGGVTTLAEKIGARGSGGFSKISSVGSAVISKFYKSHEAAAQTLLSHQDLKFSALLAQATKKKVELESLKQVVEKSCISLPVLADDVTAILNLEPDALKTNTQTFFSETEKAPTLKVAGDKVGDMQGLLGSLYSISGDETALEIHDLQAQLTDPEVVLPKRLNPFTQLLHFATNQAEGVCHKTLKAHFKEVQVNPITFSEVAFEADAKTVVIRAQAQLTGSGVLASGSVEMMAVLAGGSCHITVKVQNVKINPLATEQGIRSLSGAYASSSDAKVGAVQSV